MKPWSYYRGYCYLNLFVILISWLFEFAILISLFTVLLWQSLNVYSSSKPVNIKKTVLIVLFICYLFIWNYLFPFIGDWFKGYYQYSFVLVYPVGIFYLLFWVFVIWLCFINDNGWLLLNVGQSRGGVCLDGQWWQWTVMTWLQKCWSLWLHVQTVQSLYIYVVFITYPTRRC